jgi:hypothetical protein
MRHIFYYKDGTQEVFEEVSSSDIIVSTADYPVLGAQIGMFSVKFSDDRAVYIPFDSVRKVASLHKPDDEVPGE